MAEAARHNSGVMISPLSPQKLTLFRRIPMPLLSILIGLVCGLLVWGILEQVQPKAVEDIFSQELESRLQQQARETLIRFDNYVLSHVATTRLLANHRELARYLEPLYWLENQQWELQNHFQTPPWLPPMTLWESLVRPSHLLLVDEQGEIREIFHADDRYLPNALKEGADLTQGKQRVQSNLISLSNKPYLLISEIAEDVTGTEMGALFLLAPIDQQFMQASQQGISSGDVVVGILDSSGERFLATSDQKMIPVDTFRKDMEQSYLVTIQEITGAENAKIELQFATLIPIGVVDAIRNRVTELEYRQRFIAASFFVIVFTLVFFLLSARLNQILQRISRFSQRALGAKPTLLVGGNQLFVLEDWIQNFIQLVRNTREDMRQQHETEMRESEALKQVILETAPDSIATIDEHGKVVEFNYTAQQIFALERSHAIGQDFASLVLHKQSRPLFLQLFGNLLRDEDSVDGVRHDMVAIRANGESFPVELAMKPIKLGNRTALAVYLHDVSDRVKAQDKIRELARFTSESPNPILRVNQRGVILYANRASDYLLEYWGCERAQTLPQYWRNRLIHTLGQGEPWETQLICDSRTYLLIFSPVRDSDYVNIYGRDITAVKKAEQLARQHQQELVHVCRLSTMGEMATGLAHELNQPLSAIANYANGSTRRLRKQKDVPEDILFALQQINAQADRAGEIIRRLRGLVGKQPPVRSVADINDLVREVCSFVEFEARKERAVIVQELSLESLCVRVDIVQIEQVMLNLLRNALDALLEIPEDNRRVVIQTHRLNESSACIKVIDSGSGIKPEVMEHLFEPFFTTKKSGMGVGLVISQTIMEDHKGSISAEMLESGETCFTMRLPSEKRYEK